MGPHKYFSYYYPNWALTNISHIITKIRPQNYTISIKGQTYLSLAKPKKPSKFITKPIATRHTLQSPLLHDTDYTASITKPIATRHLLQSPLLHDTNYKVRYFTKPVITQHPLQSSLLHSILYKARCYMVPYYKLGETLGNIYQSPDPHLALIFYKIPKYF